VFDLLATRGRRRLLFALLYVTEGAPIGYLWWALPTRMAEAGVSADDIGGYAALITIPWIAKFAWAPAVDALRSRAFGLREWVVAAQLAMAAALVPHLIVDPVLHWDLLVLTGLAHGFAAATQDVAIDALAIRSTGPGERGSINASMQVGMFGGRAVFGAGGLVLGSQLGAGGPAALLVALLLASAATVTACVPRGHEVPGTAAGRFATAVRGTLALPRFWWGLGVAVLAGVGFELIGLMTGPLLIAHGADEARAGWFFAAVTTPCLALGSIVGGVCADRAGARPATAWLVCITATVAISFGLADDPGAAPPSIGLQVLLGAVAFAAGALVTASYALFMSRVGSGAPATMFTAWMAGTNLCEAWTAEVGGTLIERTSFGTAFAVLGLVSLLSLIPLGRFDPPPVSETAEP
jgi:hypothetical protein